MKRYRWEKITKLDKAYSMDDISNEFLQFCGDNVAKALTTLYFGNSEKDNNWNWKLAELKLKIVTEYIYLGIKISKNMEKCVTVKAT